MAPIFEPCNIEQMVEVYYMIIQIIYQGSAMDRLKPLEVKSFGTRAKISIDSVEVHWQMLYTGLCRALDPRMGRFLSKFHTMELR